MTAKSGAVVYELFNMYGWKGGTISLGIKDDTFPLNQYTLNSLIIDTTFEYGAKYYAKASITAMRVTVAADALFLSNDANAFIQLSEGGELVKRFDEVHGNVYFDMYGDSRFNNLEIDLGKILILWDYSISTAGVQIPIPGNFRMSVKSGTTTVPSDVQIKLLPGAQVNVEQGAKLDIQGALYGYGEGCATYSDGLTKWQDGKLGRGYPHTSSYKSTHRLSSVEPDYTDTTPAKLNVGGTVNVASGGILAAGVYGLDGGKLVVDGGASLSGSIQEDNSTGGANGTFTATLTAKLADLQADGSYVTKDVTAGKTYTCTGGVWA